MRGKQAQLGVQALLLAHSLSPPAKPGSAGQPGHRRPETSKPFSSKSLGADVSEHSQEDGHSGLAKPRDLRGCCQHTPRHAGHAPSIKKEVFSFSSKSTWMALSGSSPCRERSRLRTARRSAASSPGRRADRQSGEDNLAAPSPLEGWSFCRHLAGKTPLPQGLSHQESQEALGADCKVLPA